MGHTTNRHVGIAEVQVSAQIYLNTLNHTAGALRVFEMVALHRGLLFSLTSRREGHDGVVGLSQRLRLC